MKLFISTFLCLACIIEVFAHRENEITLQLTPEKLTVLLTPKSGMDLLESKGLITKDQSIISFQNHLDVFETYCNQHISINRKGYKPVKLSLAKANFNGHDATLEFNVEGLPLDAENIQVDITLFSELYSKVIYVVQWGYNDHIIEQYMLNQEYSTCTINKVAPHHIGDFSWLRLFLIALVTILFSITGYNIYFRTQVLNKIA